MLRNEFDLIENGNAAAGPKLSGADCSISMLHLQSFLFLHVLAVLY